jgi:hypothetical protein
VEKQWIRQMVVAVTSGMLVALGLMMTRQAQGAEKMDHIAVALYNYAGVLPEMLKLAEGQASKIYGQAGVMIDWREIPVSASDSNRLVPVEIGVPITAYVRLVRGSSELMGIPYAFGFAIRNLVYVFNDTVVQAAGKKGCPLPIALGHVIAHEIGHVLLGRAHTFNSIMDAKLGQNEFDFMQIGGTLLFRSWQVKQLHERIGAANFDQEGIRQF